MSEARESAVSIDRARSSEPHRATRVEEAGVVPMRPRNAGIPLDLDLIRDQRANRSAIERRAATLGKRRSIKKEWQAAWLLRAATMIDSVFAARAATSLQGAHLPQHRLVVEQSAGARVNDWQKF